MRRYRSEDLPALMDVRASAIRDVAARDYTPAQIDAWIAAAKDRDVLARRFGEDTITWVACDGAGVVGFTNLGAGGYLDCMYVHGAYQGRGAASLLLAALEQEACMQQQARIHSEVSLTARPFFESRGYQVVAPQRVTVNGQTYDNFRMEKRL